MVCYKILAVLDYYLPKFNVHGIKDERYLAAALQLLDLIMTSQSHIVYKAAKK